MKAVIIFLQKPTSPLKRIVKMLLDFSHLNVLNDDFSQQSHIRVSDSPGKVRLGKLICHLRHHQLYSKVQFVGKY